MSPPAHLMLRGPPQRVASLALAWHTARRQRHIHAAECLRTAQSWQPVKANAMAEPPCTRPGARPAEPRPTTTAAWLGPAGGVWAKGWFQEGELVWQEGWWRRCIIDEGDSPLAFGGGGRGFPLLPLAGATMLKLAMLRCSQASRCCTINQSQRTCFTNGNVTALWDFMLRNENKQGTRVAVTTGGVCSIWGPL